jgi:hypothetical protein
MAYWDSTPQVASSNFTTTSTSLVNITGLTFAAAASSLYEVQVVLKVQSSNTTGMQWSIACSAAGATGEFICISHTTTATNAQTYQSNVIGTANAIDLITSSTADAIVTIYAVVTTVGATGNITAQVQKTTSGTATVYIGSILKIKKLA